MKLKNSPSGFTLVEAAIIITILGLILAPFFSYLARENVKEEKVSDEKAHERITAAIATYLAEHSRYPCPADPTLDPTDPMFGIEERDAAVGIEIANCVSSWASNTYYGAVPVRTLRLSMFDTVNSFDWKYMYVVSDQLADADYGTSAVDIFDSSTGQITVEVDLNNDNDTLDTNESQAGVHFVVINPGQNGLGSYNLQGQQDTAKACPTSGKEEENCNNDALFQDWSQADTETSIGYDDTLIYSMVRKESTFWEVDNNTTGLNTGGVDMKIRADGNIGIGLDSVTPDEKVHIKDGNLKVRSSASGGGNLLVDENLDATSEIETTGDVDTEGRVGAPIFYYCDTATPGSCPSF